MQLKTALVNFREGVACCTVVVIDATILAIDREWSSPLRLLARRAVRQLFAFSTSATRGAK
jgi:hypothetical protein